MGLQHPMYFLIREYRILLKSKCRLPPYNRFNVHFFINYSLVDFTSLLYLLDILLFISDFVFSIRGVIFFILIHAHFRISTTLVAMNLVLIIPIEVDVITKLFVLLVYLDRLVHIVFSYFDWLLHVMTNVRGSLTSTHGLRLWNWHLVIQIVRHDTSVIIHIVILNLILIEIDRVSILRRSTAVRSLGEYSQTLPVLWWRILLGRNSTSRPSRMMRLTIIIRGWAHVPIILSLFAATRLTRGEWLLIVIWLFGLVVGARGGSELRCCVCVWRWIYAISLFGSSVRRIAGLFSLRVVSWFIETTIKTSKWILFFNDSLLYLIIELRKQTLSILWGQFLPYQKWFPSILSRLLICIWHTLLYEWINLSYISI